MRYILTLLLLLTPACLTPQGDVDWEATGASLGDVSRDLDDAAVALRFNDPDLSELFSEAAEALHGAAEAMQGGGDAPGRAAAIAAALEATEPLLAREDIDDALKAGIIVARGILRRMQ